MYIKDLPEFRLITHSPKTKLFYNVVKFAEHTGPKILFAYCDDIMQFDQVKWDIYVLLFTKKGSPEDKKVRTRIQEQFKSVVPLFAVISPQYVLVTKIISMQIFQLSQKGCCAEGILDLYLYEMGAVLVPTHKSSGAVLPPMEYRGTSGVNIWPISKELAYAVDFIEPRMHGWFSKNTELLLRHVISTYKADYIVELGSWYGKSTSSIIKMMHDSAKLYCIDKFQNIAVSSYDFKSDSPLDDFYFETPRYETFVRNIMPAIDRNKTIYTIKNDVNDVVGIMSKLMVRPDIIFVDAIKNTRKLVQLYIDIFRFNPKIVIVGDDYVFNSVKKAVSTFLSRPNSAAKINIYYTADAYLMTALPIDTAKIRKLFRSEYFAGEWQTYDKVYENIMANQSIKVNLQGIDVNLPIPHHNSNTLYTLATLSQYKHNEYTKWVLSQTPEAVPNVLGLTYKDYELDNKLIW